MHERERVPGGDVELSPCPGNRTVGSNPTVSVKKTLHAPKYGMEFRQWLENEEQDNDGKYWVRTSDLGVMDAKLEKLNRRAAKLKMPPVTMRKLSSKVDREVGPDGRRQDVSKTQIELVGAAPKLKGWTFIARIMHGEGGNLIMGAPGEEVPAKYRTSPPACDHCRSNRNRKDTFVVRSDQGEYKQVGTNCLRDFLGTEDPAAYVLYFSELKSLMDDIESDFYGGGGRASNEIETLNFVTTTIAVIRKLGFVSKRSAEERGGTTTSSDVSRYYFDGSKDGKKFQEAIDEVRRPDDSDKAKKMIDWARSLKDAGNDDMEQYMWNLSVASEKLTVDPKTAGLIASLPMAYDRANGTSSVASRPAVAAPPTPTLKAGDKFEGVLTVEKVRSWENDYGVTTLHIMKDEAGQTYKWKASRESLDEGSKVRIKGTVKVVEPDKYNGNIPTVELTRCKVINVVVDEEQSNSVAQKADLEKRWKDILGVERAEAYVTMGRNSYRRLSDEEISDLAVTVAIKMFKERGGDPDRLFEELKNRGPHEIRYLSSSADAFSEKNLETAMKFIDGQIKTFSDLIPKAQANKEAEGVIEKQLGEFNQIKKDIVDFLAVLRSRQVSDSLAELKELADKLWSIHVIESRTKGRSVETGR